MNFFGGFWKTDEFIDTFWLHLTFTKFLDSKTEFEPTVSRCARGSFANYAGTYIHNTGLVFEGNPVFKSYINESAKARTIK